jgi:photosystem II stability/assembly factor-like uncharacterized protein
MRRRLLNKRMIMLLATFILPVGLLAQHPPFILNSQALTVELSKQVKIIEMTFNKSGVHKFVVAFTAIESFTVQKILPFLRAIENQPVLNTICIQID